MPEISIRREHENVVLEIVDENSQAYFPLSRKEATSMALGL